MSVFRLCAAGMCALFAAAVHAQSADQVALAQRAAQAWLASIDAANYAQSWDEAASVFQEAVAKAQWETAARSARGPLGALKERKTKSATFTRSLPGAPDGEYVVIQYDSRFENKAKAVETVTPMRDKDGRWKVSGYYIK